MFQFVYFVYRYMKHQTNVQDDTKMSAIMHENSSSLFWIVTILVMISSLIPNLVSYICLLYCHHNKNESKSREQLTILKNQLREINMMDQFAKHAKIQRKINKIQDELSDKNMSKNFFEIKLKFYSYVILYTVTGLAMMYISWTYKYVPLLILKSNLFYPFGPILAFPTGVDGAIGIVPWICVTTTIFKKLIEFCTSNSKPLNTITDEDISMIRADTT